MRAILPLICSVPIFVVGCKSIPFPNTSANADGLVESGSNYCKRLATTADVVSQRELGWGITFTVLAGAATLAGTAMGPSEAADANWLARNRNSLTVGAGGLLSIPTTVLLMRSKHAASASSAATLAVQSTLSEEAKMDACLRARSEFSGARRLASNEVISAQEDAADDGGTADEEDGEEATEYGDDTDSPASSEVDTERDAESDAPPEPGTTSPGEPPTVVYNARKLSTSGQPDVMSPSDILDEIVVSQTTPISIKTLR